jgi:hypothetical protein
VGGVGGGVGAGVSWVGCSSFGSLKWEEEQVPVNGARLRLWYPAHFTVRL